VYVDKMTQEPKFSLYIAMLAALSFRGEPEERLYTIGNYLGMTENETRELIILSKRPPICEIPKEKLDEIICNISTYPKGRDSFSVRDMIQFCMSLGLNKEEAKKMVFTSAKILYCLERKKITKIYTI